MWSGCWRTGRSGTARFAGLCGLGANDALVVFFGGSGRMFDETPDNRPGDEAKTSDLERAQLCPIYQHYRRQYPTLRRLRRRRATHFGAHLLRSAQFREQAGQPLDIVGNVLRRDSCPQA